MDKGLEHTQAPGVAHRQQTRQHGLTVVTVILADPLLDLLFDRIQFGSTVRSRMGHGDQLGVTQLLAPRIPGDAQGHRDVLNGLSDVADNWCIVFTVLLLIMAVSCGHAQQHFPQRTAISGVGQFYLGAIIHGR